MDLPFAERMNYWKTSKASAESWITKTENLIEALGGEVHLHARGKDRAGRHAYLMEFSFDQERFRLIWPILPLEFSYRDNSGLEAAFRQAATMLYHDAKARALRAKIMGPRNAFFEFLLLESGQTMGEMSTPQLSQLSPRFLLAGAQS